MPQPTDLDKFMHDLDAGIFHEKVSELLSQVAGAVIDISDFIGNGKTKGAVTLKFELQRIGESYQVSVAHEIGYSMPTRYGAKTEKELKVTPMHVGKGGCMTFMPGVDAEMLPGQPNLFAGGK